MEIHEKIKLNGLEVDCEVDTGTVYMVLTPDIIRKAGLKPGELPPT